MSDLVRWWESRDVSKDVVLQALQKGLNTVSVVGPNDTRVPYGE
jgi:hypothetical protein